MAEPARTRQPGSRLRAAVGWIITTVLISGIVVLVPIGDVVDAIARADIWLLLLALIPVSVNLWLRGTRWAVLLRTHLDVRPSEALGPAMVGMALNAVLPGRVGDFARISLGSRKFGATFAFVAGTVVVERLLDVAVLLGFLSLSTTLVEPPDGATVTVLGRTLTTSSLVESGRRLGLISACLLGIVLALLSRPLRDRLLALLSRLPRYGSRAYDWAKPRLHDIALGLGALGRPRLLLGATFWSVLIWLSLAASNLFVAMAIDGIELSLLAALTVTALAVGASFLPSAPGAWGLYEAGALLGLTISGALPDDASVGVAFAVLSHVMTYVPVIVAGGIANLTGSGRTPRSRREVAAT